MDSGDKDANKSKQEEEEEAELILAALGGRELQSYLDCEDPEHQHQHPVHHPVGAQAQVHPPTSLLAALLAWDCVSVLSAGVAAGSVCHLVAWPFNRALQSVENAQIKAAIHNTHLFSDASSSAHGATAAGPKFAPISAWAHLRTLYRHGGILQLFRGAWGGSGHLVSGASTSMVDSAAHTAKRPSIFSPLTVGLCVFTLSKTEHHSNQLHQWRADRKRRRDEAKQIRHVHVE